MTLKDASNPVGKFDSWARVAVRHGMDGRTLCVRARRRGFTLAEVMAVVVIMGILGTIGIASIRGHLEKAHRTEVHAVLKSIAAAQETYRSEHMRYHDTSPLLSDLYPMTSPGANEYAFYGWSGTLADSWAVLGPQVTAPVTFGYAAKAGLPTETLTDFPATALSTQPTWVATRSPWFVVQAQGDQDGDGTRATAVMTSFSSAVIWENEGE